MPPSSSTVAAASRRRRHPPPRRNPAAWCCSFAAVPGSPDSRSLSKPSTSSPSRFTKPSSSSTNAVGFPSPSSKLALGRRILSPGRVSPIPETLVASVPDRAPSPRDNVQQSNVSEQSSSALIPKSLDGLWDLRMRIKGKDGKYLEMEMESRVLLENSKFFASKVAKRQELNDSGGRRIVDVEDVEDVGVFKEAIELMYEPEPMKWLAAAGVSHAIDVLQVSSSIVFNRGVVSCLRYIEAAPWSESEEEKLKALFAKHTFGEPIAQDVLARLYPQGPTDSDDLAVYLIQSVTNGTNNNSRKELKALVSGLLSKSSVYQKDPAGLNKESLYRLCDSCLNSLGQLFQEASGIHQISHTSATKETRPLVERISKQVENLNWLLEILIDNQMAEDFVALWAKQKELIVMHENSSPMVRYEVSRISASVFIALGKGKIQCPGDVRSSVLGGWFGPMMMDFGWLQRCSKGLDVKVLGDCLGQALLTLPLTHQQTLFVEWFRCFSSQGTECPNLSRAFQVWWRRSFIRTSEKRG